MNQQDALTTSLYSYLFEEAIANESDISCPGMQGSFSKESRRNSVYWYCKVGRNNGKVTRIYIGADNKETENLIVSLENRKDMAKLAITSMKRTTTAYRGAGGQLIEPIFKIIAPLANFFRKGVFIIGSHGFLSICSALGISSSLTAEPLPFIDYLLGGEPFKGLVIGSYAIPVHLPNPARFAIHKLIISQCADRLLMVDQKKILLRRLYFWIIFFGRTRNRLLML